jgi:hypothetical protein
MHGEHELINLTGFFYLTSAGFLSTVRKLSNYIPDLITVKHNYRGMYSVYTRKLEAGEQFTESRPGVCATTSSVFSS